MERGREKRWREGETWKGGRSKGVREGGRKRRIEMREEKGKMRGSKKSGRNGRRMGRRNKREEENEGDKGKARDGSYRELPIYQYC